LYFPGGTKPFHRFEKTVLPVGRNKRNFHAAIMLHRTCRVLIEKKSTAIENTNAARKPQRRGDVKVLPQRGAKGTKF
jgi:hypothetical protein